MSKIKNQDKFQKQLQTEISNVVLDIDFLGTAIMQKNRPTNNASGYLTFKEITDVKQLYNQRLRNILLIKNGEVPFRSLLGSNCYTFLYNPDVTWIITNLKSHIESQIKLFFTTELTVINVTVSLRSNTDVNIYEDQNRLMMDVVIDYEIPFLGQNNLKLILNSMEQEENI